MTKPDLMAELAEFARLDAVALDKSYYEGIDAREQRDDFAVNFLRTHHAELEAVVSFHAFFADRCEGLYHEFGWDAIDLYNAASRAMHNSAREGL